MEAVNLSDFYSGGYFLIRSGRPDWPLPFGEFLPAGNLISLSDCICRQRLSIRWGWIPGDREAALAFGIAEARLDEFAYWCGHEASSSIDLFSMFHSPDAARAFVRRFELNTENLFIIGAALPKEHHAAWLEEEPDNEGIACQVKQALPVAESGEPLGYDVVSYNYADFAHSWLCSGLEHEMNDLFGIRAGRYGLLETAAEARQVHAWIAEDEGKGQRAEPDPYDFWLLLSYPVLG